VRVKVVRVNLEQAKIDFVLVESSEREEEPEIEPPRPRKKTKKA